MNIVMMTNAFPPLVGGVAESVRRFVDVYRQHQHNVLVVAPRFKDCKENEPGVVRIAAIQNFNGSDFSVALPPPPSLSQELTEFEPDIIHSHHPFLLGDTALRVAAARQLPAVFTYHTMYEDYTHYVPFGATRLRAFVKELCIRYANRCARVIAPSASVKKLLEQRGVTRPIDVVASGVDAQTFAAGDGGGRVGRRARPPRSAGSGTG